MSNFHQPTTWEDYPSTQTPITASEMNRLDGLSCAAYDFVDHILGRVINAESHTTVSETVTSGSTLYQQWYLFSSGFDPDHDGFIARKNGVLIPLSSCTFTKLGTGAQVTFPAGTFSEGDEVTFDIYRNPVPGQLPAGYTEMEYLEFDGAHAINTGFRPFLMAFECDIEVTRPHSTDGTGEIIGGYKSAPNFSTAVSRSFFTSSNATSTTEFQFGLWWYNGSNEYLYSTIDCTVNRRYTVSGSFDNDRMKLTVDGSTSTKPISHAGSERDVWIGNGGDNSTRDYNYYGSFKLYSMKLYGGASGDTTTTLGRDLVPARRDSDSAEGLYDLVTSAFYALGT